MPEKPGSRAAGRCARSPAAGGPCPVPCGKGRGRSQPSCNLPSSFAGKTKAKQTIPFPQPENKARAPPGLVERAPLSFLNEISLQPLAPPRASGEPPVSLEARGSGEQKANSEVTLKIKGSFGYPQGKVEGERSPSRQRTYSRRARGSATAPVPTPAPALRALRGALGPQRARGKHRLPHPLTKAARGRGKASEAKPGHLGIPFPRGAPCPGRAGQGARPTTYKPSSFWKHLQATGLRTRYVCVNICSRIPTPRGMQPPVCVCVCITGCIYTST